MRVLRLAYPWLGAAGIIAAGGGLGGGCYGATQATLLIDTDVACGAVGRTAITVGADSEETESSPPHAIAVGCLQAEGAERAEGHVGTLVLVPSGDRDARISVRIVTGADPAQCTKENGYKGCIVARRSLRYIEHSSMRLPIAMRESCRDIPCSQASTTCVRGQCVSSEIAPELCTGDGCGEDKLLPVTPAPVDAGPDANDDANDGGSGDAGCVPGCAGRTLTVCANGVPREASCATACNGGTCATVTDIAAGAFHTCALLSNGDVHCWGETSNLELGLPPGPRRFAPTDRVALPTPARVLRAGGSHTCVLTTTNDAYCWGANNAGQITFAPSTAEAPRMLLGVSGLIALAVGDAFSCTGSASLVACQGSNAQGQLGAGTTVATFAQHTVASSALAAGGMFGCMRDAVAPSSLKCWGANEKNQLGTAAPGPVTLAASSDVLGLPNALEQFVAGSDFACALGSDQAFCWGNGGSGALGTGAALAQSATPVHVAIPGDNVAQLGTGPRASHACAVTNDGATYCWGLNTSLQVGSQPIGVAPQPRVVNIGPAISVTAGSLHTCALLRSREVFCWGFGSAGQLGYGADPALTPQPPRRVLWP